MPGLDHTHKIWFDNVLIDNRQESIFPSEMSFFDLKVIEISKRTSP